jgi:membrane-bound ClpP family serine protease
MAGYVFLALFVFSAVFSIGAFLFGHDSDHEGGGDGGGGGEAGMPSIFSGRVISLFLLGFSGMGLIAHYAWHLSAGGATLCGLGSGVVLGAVAYGMCVLFFTEQASSLPDATDYAGLDGRVCTGIPEKGTGEIAVTVKEQRRTLFAVSADGTAIPEGQPVKIASVSGGTATVSRV